MATRKNSPLLSQIITNFNQLRPRTWVEILTYLLYNYS